MVLEADESTPASDQREDQGFRGGRKYAGIRPEGGSRVIEADESTPAADQREDQGL